MESLNERMRHDEDELFKNEPRLNVISKETYENRVSKVFNLLWKTLAKSFGPYGAPTLIYNFPFSHVTKDGFTIMKNISMDSSDQLVDQAIANMASDICGRLNYSVGDGTTSAVIATNSIYQNYLKHKKELENQLIMPRDIIQAYNNIKGKIINHLNKYVQSIQSTDPKELYDNIYKVVYISSNGDNIISDYIASMYAELQFPGVTCELASDGITRKRIITGYKFDLVLNDKLYINSDDNTMDVSNIDVIMFSVKITKAIYQNILVPLNEQCRIRGRKLLVCASAYDETALGQTITRDLTNEYKKTHDINMVLCTYRSISDHTRKLASDFAMLCNTVIIDRELKSYIEHQLDEGANILNVFNIDGRDDIENLVCVGFDKKTNGATRYINSTKSELIQPFECNENAIRLGYVGKASVGLKSSLFTDFYYNENQYNAVLKDAEITLKETEDKYKKLGTFNIVVNQAQQRYYSLKLKMGIVEVGADSELSQKLLKDAVDDAIKAAASAFDHGIVKGCNVDMIRAINDTIEECTMTVEIDDSSKSIYLTLLTILRDGFIDVYKTVLSNAFSDVNIMNYITESEDNTVINTSNIINAINNFFKKAVFDKDSDTEYESINEEITRNILNENKDNTISLHNILINHSVKNEVVFDVSTKKFSSEVINSSQTDEEILIATIDLISLLITGNQMLITQKHNF